MYNNIYLQEIRKNKNGLTPAENIEGLFSKELTEKDKTWLLFEDEIFVKKMELKDVPFEQNLRNIIFVSNNSMTNQILKVLYNNDYNPFTDLINLEWFNETQQKYLLKCFDTLTSINKAKDNFLIGVDQFSLFTVSEYNSKNIDIKDLFFFYGIDILLTYTENSNIKKIYFNSETLSLWQIQIMMRKIQQYYNIKIIKESFSIEVESEQVFTRKLHSILNEVNFEELREMKEEKTFKYKFKGAKKQ